MAIEKKAVLRARRPPRSRGVSAMGSSGTAALHYAAAARDLSRGGIFAQMANIASQEKRIHRAERERAENRRYTSSVKTYLRRLEVAVESKDADAAEAEFRAVCSQIDRAVRSGAFHRNTGARKKARAARIRASV